MSTQKERFVLTLDLETSAFQADVLAKRFEIGRKLYNSVLHVSLKRYRELVKTKAWRANEANIKELIKKNNKTKSKELKPFYENKREMLRFARLSEYELHKDIAPMQKHFRKNIDSSTAQKIASQAWSAYDSVLFSKGKKLSFKNYYIGLNTLEGKTNKTGIRYLAHAHCIIWNNLRIPVQRKLTPYESECLRHDVKYCAIKRTFVRGKIKYSVQLILEGTPPPKVKSETGEFQALLGSGDVGIDIGTQTLAYTSNSSASLTKLAPSVQNIEDEKRRIQRYMDRSKRALNPNNYKEDGTVKKGRLQWTYSKRYARARNQLKELYRKQAALRKQDHFLLVNELIQLGDTFKIEKMNFQGLQRRAKNTTMNEKTGKYNRKNRFGKSLANRAPAMFVTMLKNKIHQKGGTFIEIDTAKVKASQYNHVNQECIKKKLSQRWSIVGNEKVQRDLYSAFLIQHVENKTTINNEDCEADFSKFIEYHNQCIEGLKGQNNLSSMGIH